MAGRQRSARFIVWIVAVLGFAALLVVWQLYRPAWKTKTALVSVPFGALPGWNTNDPRPALQALARSCSVLMRRAPHAMMGAGGYAGTAADWQEVCRNLPGDHSPPMRLRAWFEGRFRALEVQPSSGSEALFTGYYEPQLAASRTRHGPFQAPIYALPENLINVDLGEFRNALRGERLIGCAHDHHLRRCPARAEIDADGLGQSRVLFYAADPIAVFFLHIQGSGRVRLEDGSFVRVAYAGQNGRPYTAIGRTLVARRLLNRNGMSMQVIRDWLHRNPAQARETMETDQSYIFFKEARLGDPVLGSAGSQGVPLTPGASLAIDPRIHPYGAPTYIAATRPDANANKSDQAFNRLLIAQDSGGAIRGPARGDVFWGFGNDAESIAGRMKATGRFFILLPKAVAARLGHRRVLTAS